MTTVSAEAQSLIPDPALIEDLVAANRILYDQGVVDGFGHVSLRHDKVAEHFLLARSMAPGLVTNPDIMEFDRDGNAVDPQGRAVYLERFIHSEIYKARPEVKAVVHSHSPAVIPFGVTSVPLRPIFHLSSFLGAGAPVFEIRESVGPATDILIRTAELGAALSRTLGTAPVALMRGHGDVVVASSLKEVVFRAVYTEVNARLEAEALRLAPIGQITFLNDEEAAKATATNAATLGRLNAEKMINPGLLCRHGDAPRDARSLWYSRAGPEPSRQPRGSLLTPRGREQDSDPGRYLGRPNTRGTSGGLGSDVASSTRIHRRDYRIGITSPS